VYVNCIDVLWNRSWPTTRNVLMKSCLPQVLLRNTRRRLLTMSKCWMRKSKRCSTLTTSSVNPRRNLCLKCVLHPYCLVICFLAFRTGFSLQSLQSH